MEKSKTMEGFMNHWQKIKTPFWVFTCWTIPLLIMTFLIHSRTHASGEPSLSFFKLLGNQILIWYPLAIMTLVILRLSVRWPIRKPVILKHLLFHLGIAFLTAILLKTILVLTELWMMGALFAGGALLRIVWPEVFNWGLLVYLFLYSVILWFGQMLNLVKQNQQQKLQMAEDRLQMLTQQLQPHFLFNTLNAISTLMEEDLDGARTMTARLGDLLRASLAHGEDREILLSQELALLASYLSIQKVRFSDRLQVEMKIQPQAERALVPPLMLQPIVENAIRHGLKKDGGVIGIQASLSQERLILSVEDDGPGFQSSQTTEGIGLANCRDRLDVLYGDEAKLSCLNRPLEGARVEISLPKKLVAGYE